MKTYYDLTYVCPRRITFIGIARANRLFMVADDEL
jgi:hypothetical protein